MVPLGEQHRRALVVAYPRRIAAASVGEMGSQEHVQAEISQRALQWHETDALEHHVAPWIGDNFLLDAIATIIGGVPNPIGQNAWRQLHRLRTRIPFFFREECLTIGDDETEVSRASVIDAGVIN